MNFLNITPENQHLLDEHESSKAALEKAVAASKRYREIHGQDSEELTNIVLAANRRHMDAHQAVMNAASKQAAANRTSG